VEGFIAEHTLTNPTLIGHSMGAKTAMAVALRKRSAIDRLISIDNAPVDAALKSDFGNYITAMRRIEEAGVTKQSEADVILQEYEEVSLPPSLNPFSNPPPPSHETRRKAKNLKKIKSLPIRQFLLTNLHRPPSTPPGSPLKFRIPIRTLYAALPAMADFPFRDPDAACFKKPTLFVRGTKSHYVPDETLPIIGRFFPRFEVVDLEAGHWVVSERPEEFRGAVVGFLRGGVEDGDGDGEE